MTRDGRLGVGIIGAGRVGPIVGAALAGAGHAVVGITHGSDDDRASSVLPGVPVLDAEEVVRRGELVVLAVPHDQLAGLVSGLAELDAWQQGQLVMHTDPAFGLDVLAPAAARGAIVLAIHPAIVFTGTSMDLHQLADAFAAVTAPAAVLPIAQALAVEMGCEPVVVDDADRAAYAEAVSIATTFSRSIVQQASTLLAAAGVENPRAFLSTIVHSSVDQALAEPPAPGAAPVPQ